jgi:hypothetical protein
VTAGAVTRQALLALAVDAPRWVEARAMLLAGAPIVPAGGGAIVVSPDGGLGVALGDAAPSTVVAAARDGDVATLLVAIERDEVRAALAAGGWQVGRGILHTLADPTALPDGDGAVPLPGDAGLSHLPAPLAAEIERARRDRVVHAAYVDGAPVSFAYAPWATERWFDISVETAPGARQLGLATRVAAAMIHAGRDGGRAPVWGATEDNVASLRMAARLGFAACDAVWVAARPPR